MTRYLTCTTHKDGPSKKYQPSTQAASSGVRPAPEEASGLSVLISADARRRAEARQAQGMDPVAALLLPLAVSLARLQARQAHEDRLT